MANKLNTIGDEMLRLSGIPDIALNSVQKQMWTEDINSLKARISGIISTFIEAAKNLLANIKIKPDEEDYFNSKFKIIDSIINDLKTYYFIQNFSVFINTLEYNFSKQVT